MRHGDSNPKPKRSLTRRQYAQILAGASAASIAGCTGGDGDDTTDDTGGGNETDTDDTTGGEDGVPAQDEFNRETIRVWANNVPSQMNMNKFAETDRTNGELYMTELTAPVDATTNEKLFDGHTWDATWVDWYDEITVPTVFTGLEINPPYETREIIRGNDGNEPLTFWDGTELNAEAFELQEWMWYYDTNDHLSDDAQMEWEAESEYVFLHTQPEDSGRNELVLYNDHAPSHDTPMHPDFNEPYVERYSDATTEDDTQPIHDDVHSARVSLEDYADNGYGSGLYEIDPETINQASVTLTTRDDHPNDQWTIPEMEVLFADADRWPTLARHGQLDLGEDIVQEETGEINRQILPDHMQELHRYQMPNGDHFAMNWNNPHLARLWVRRAIVAAIDWIDYGANGWGADNSITNQYDAGCTDPIQQSWFSEDFLDSLHQYPREQELETAADYLQRAGYTGSMSDGWTGPGGRELAITLDQHTGIADWTGAYQTAQAHLQELGINVTLEPLDPPTWQQRMGQGNVANPSYTATNMWSDSPPIWRYYNVNGQWWTYPLVGGDPDSGWAGDADPQDLQSDVDNHGRPFVQDVPTEAGAFEAPDEAGPTFDVPVETEEVNLADECVNLRRSDTTEDEFMESARKAARYYNYYLPFFCFHSYPQGQWGNVRDFHFPGDDDPAARVHKEFNAVDYFPQAAVAQGKTTDDYPEP